jgi:hypothetical protein
LSSERDDLRENKIVAMVGIAKQARTCILVLGMHRSGTSALARVVSLLGATLPRDLNRGTIDNVVDYWEPLRLVECHNAMLQATGSHWDDWRAFRSDELAAGLFDRFKDEISDTLKQQFDDAPLFVLKDPRISRFIPLYRNVLDAMGIAARYILALRNPLAVMMSLRERDEMTPGFAGLMWLRHTLDAERATRGRPRVVTSYERLVADWRRVVADVAAGLKLDWPTPPQAAASAVDSFLTPSMQHHAFAVPDLENHAEISIWIKETYMSMRLLEQDPGALPAFATLDRISADFDRWAPIFGEACFPELAVARSQRDTLRGERDAVGVELQAVQATLRNEAEQSALHARRSASLEAELERVRSSQWWRFAERMRAFERRFRFRRKGHR